LDLEGRKTDRGEKVHKDELHGLCSHNIVRMIKSRRMRLAGHVACIGRGEAFTGFWSGGPESLGRPRRRWENNIKMDLR
jgi:hypothetical protein